MSREVLVSAACEASSEMGSPEMEEKQAEAGTHLLFQS